MNGKLSTLLDDPEVRELIFAMASVTPPSGGSVAARLHAVLLNLAETTTKEQYGSWLSDGAVNKAITVEQVRMTIGDSAIDDLAQLMSASPGIVAWQLAAVLPDLVDAVSPGGAVVDADRACPGDR
ncbi:YidB family protein [Kibdelosporangium aridum]|uniref:YidB family protein n=1 Tax=Kibdelosporangium aridum TaxID=2030 RepID=UPI000527842E